MCVCLRISGTLGSSIHRWYAPGENWYGATERAFESRYPESSGGYARPGSMLHAPELEPVPVAAL